MTALTLGDIRKRSRSNDLDAITKLNLWASNLNDVGMLRYLPNLQVLNLSMNGLSTLRDISGLKNLVELYVRKNCIVDLSEVCHLRNMPALAVLWLADNPCCATSPERHPTSSLLDYRRSILRNLPSLLKLDNLDVTDEERLDAMTNGIEYPVMMLEDVEDQRVTMEIAPPRQDEHNGCHSGQPCLSPSDAYRLSLETHLALDESRRPLVSPTAKWAAAALSPPPSATARPDRGATFLGRSLSGFFHPTSPETSAHRGFSDSASDPNGHSLAAAVTLASVPSMSPGPQLIVPNRSLHVTKCVLMLLELVTSLDDLLLIRDQADCLIGDMQRLRLLSGGRQSPLDALPSHEPFM